MTSVTLRQQAIELRKQGKTYSEIKRILHVPKSTLSEWLSKLPLTEKQLTLLTKNKNIIRKEITVEKYRNTMRIKREKRLQITYSVQKKAFLPLSKRELELAGMFLYWGEGQKKINGAIGINNTDPKVVKFSLYWLIKSLDIPKEKIRPYLHLYNDMNVKNEIEFWSNQLKIPMEQFAKPYIKKSSREGLTHKGFGHGTCALIVGNVLLKEKIMMSIEAISDYYSQQIEAMI